MIELLKFQLVGVKMGLSKHDALSSRPRVLLEEPENGDDAVVFVIILMRFKSLTNGCAAEGVDEFAKPVSVLFGSKSESSMRVCIWQLR